MQPRCGHAQYYSLGHNPHVHRRENSPLLRCAQAFDVLSRLDPSDNSHWEAKRGACCGVFQQVATQGGKKDQLKDVVSMLKGGPPNPSTEYLVQVMSKWLQDNKGNESSHHRAGSSLVSCLCASAFTA